MHHGPVPPTVEPIDPTDSEATMTTTTTSHSTQSANGGFDPARAEAFAGRLMGSYTGGMVTYMVDVGYRTNLFAAAAEGPATSETLARRAGLEERYVREW